MSLRCEMANNLSRIYTSLLIVKGYMKRTYSKVKWRKGCLTGIVASAADTQNYQKPFRRNKAAFLMPEAETQYNAFHGLYNLAELSCGRVGLELCQKSYR